MTVESWKVNCSTFEEEKGGLKRNCQNRLLLWLGNFCMFHTFYSLSSFSHFSRQILAILASPCAFPLFDSAHPFMSQVTDRPWVHWKCHRWREWHWQLAFSILSHFFSFSYLHLAAFVLLANVQVTITAVNIKLSLRPHRRLCLLRNYTFPLCFWL